jgi:hypothetical protein
VCCECCWEDAFVANALYFWFEEHSLRQQLQLLGCHWDCHTWLLLLPWLQALVLLLFAQLPLLCRAVNALLSLLLLVQQQQLLQC